MFFFDNSDKSIKIKIKISLSVHKKNNRQNSQIGTFAIPRSSYLLVYDLDCIGFRKIIFQLKIAIFYFKGKACTIIMKEEEKACRIHGEKNGEKTMRPKIVKCT